MSFLRANSSIAGAVLAEFDSAYSNPAYGTESDVGGQISSDSIAAAATLTAQTLYRLAGGSGPLQVNPYLSDVHHWNEQLQSSWLLCTQCMGLSRPPFFVQADSEAITATVEQLAACLTTRSGLLRGGRDCWLADSMLARAGMESFYIGVLHTLTEDSQVSP